MKQGKVKFFNNSKGFGFIMDNDSDDEYFVHVSELVDRIKDKDSGYTARSAYCCCDFASLNLQYCTRRQSE